MAPPDPHDPHKPASSLPSQAADEQPLSRPLHALLDTNVVLDLFLRRDPWFTHAQPMWEARDRGDLVAYVSASSLTDIYYICRKPVGIARAKNIVEACLTGFTIVPVDRDLLMQALVLPGDDFEDNVQIACALAAGVDLILTRNSADFKFAMLPVVEPPDILMHLPTAFTPPKSDS